MSCDLGHDLQVRRNATIEEVIMVGTRLSTGAVSSDDDVNTNTGDDQVQCCMYHVCMLI